MTKNPYLHPQLFKGVRLCREQDEGNELTGKDVTTLLAEVPIARLWADVRGFERLGHSRHVLGADAPENVTILVLESGFIYVTDPYDQVLAAWESWLNDASLRYKNTLSN